MINEVHDESPDSCPLPPPGFHTVRIPVREIDLSVTPLLRIHWRHRDPVYYNRRSSSSTVFRFDAPNDEYGVLYAASSFDACMAETLMRGRFRGVDAGTPHVIDEKVITDPDDYFLYVKIAKKDDRGSECLQVSRLTWSCASRARFEDWTTGFGAASESECLPSTNF